MLAPLVRAITSPFAGPAALGLVLVLAGLLAAIWVSALRTQAALHAQIAELSEENRRVVLQWQAKVAACEKAVDAAEAERRVMVARSPRAGTEDARVRRLLKEEPAGIDVCARMESADRAVLETLE